MGKKVKEMRNYKILNLKEFKQKSFCKSSLFPWTSENETSVEMHFHFSFSN